MGPTVGQNMVYLQRNNIITINLTLSYISGPFRGITQKMVRTNVRF